MREGNYRSDLSGMASSCMHDARVWKEMQAMVLRTPEYTPVIMTWHGAQHDLKWLASIAGRVRPEVPAWKGTTLCLFL